MAVRLCYYEHEHDNVHNTDPYEGCYEPSSSHFSLPADEMPLLTIHGSSIQAIVKTKRAGPGFGGGYRIQIAAAGLKVVRYWVQLFQNEHDYQREFDD